jgi:Na+/H+-dicarboxylate symporter
MSLTTQVLIALVAGFALGIPLSGSESAFATGLLAVLGPVGTVFINAIRMTVIPLVVSSLIAGVTSAPIRARWDATARGRSCFSCRRRDRVGDGRAIGGPPSR